MGPYDPHALKSQVGHALNTACGYHLRDLHIVGEKETSAFLLDWSKICTTNLTSNITAVIAN